MFFTQPMWLLVMILIMYTVAVIWSTMRVWKRINSSKFQWILGAFKWPRGHYFCGPMVVVTPTSKRNMRPGMRLDPEVYHYMPDCQNHDYSANNFVLRACKDCDKLYNRYCTEKGMNVNRVNDQTGLNSVYRPRFLGPEDPLLGTDVFQDSASVESLPVAPEIDIREAETESGGQQYITDVMTSFMPRWQPPKGSEPKRRAIAPTSKPPPPCMRDPST